MESLDNAWEHFKHLVHSCPTHGQATYVLIEIFYNAMNEHSLFQMNNYTNYRLIKMDPEVAWRTLDEITDFDTTYDLRKPTRGLYEIFPEVDKDVRARF